MTNDVNPTKECAGASHSSGLSLPQPASDVTTPKATPKALALACPPPPAPDSSSKNHAGCVTASALAPPSRSRSASMYV